MTATPETPAPPRRRWLRGISARVAIALIAVLALAGIGVGRAATGGFGGSRTDASPTAGATAAATSSASPRASTAAYDPSVDFGAGDRSNVVRVVNNTDNSLRAAGRIQLNKERGPSAKPLNEADALGECIACDTLAVALQINLIAPNVHDIQPANVAVAQNYKCSGCDTVAIAFQYNVTVPDPNNVPERVREMVNTMSHELRHLHGRHITAQAAVQEVQNVLAQYNDLVHYLKQTRHDSTAGTDDGASPAPATTDVPAPTATAGASATPSPSATPSLKPTPTATPTP